MLAVLMILGGAGCGFLGAENENVQGIYVLCNVLVSGKNIAIGAPQVIEPQGVLFYAYMILNFYHVSI